jgi:hypothetical protein
VDLFFFLIGASHNLTAPMQPTCRLWTACELNKAIAAIAADSAAVGSSSRWRWSESACRMRASFVVLHANYARSVFPRFYARHLHLLTRTAPRLAIALLYGSETATPKTRVFRLRYTTWPTR